MLCGLLRSTLPLLLTSSLPARPTSLETLPSADKPVAVRAARIFDADGLCNGLTGVGAGAAVAAAAVFLGMASDTLARPLFFSGFGAGATAAAADFFGTARGTLAPPLLSLFGALAAAAIFFGTAAGWLAAPLFLSALGAPPRRFASAGTARSRPRLVGRTPRGSDTSSGTYSAAAAPVGYFDVSVSTSGEGGVGAMARRGARAAGAAAGVGAAICGSAMRSSASGWAAPVDTYSFAGLRRSAAAGLCSGSGVLGCGAVNVGVSMIGELGMMNVGEGDVGAVEIGVEGGGVLLSEAALLSDVRESGSDSIVGVRRCTWNIDGWIEFIERVRSES